MGTTISGDTGITFPDATTQSKAVSQTTPFAVTASATTGAQLNLPEGTNNGAHFVALKAPNVLAADTTFTLPAADGTTGQYLQTNGAGSLAFATVASNQITAVASGAIATGQTVFLNSDGTVSVVSNPASTSANAASSPKAIGNISTPYIATCVHSGTGNVVVAYAVNSNGGSVYITTGTVSGTTINFSTPLVANQVGTAGFATDRGTISVIDEPVSGKVVLIYTSYRNSDALVATLATSYIVTLNGLSPGVEFAIVSYNSGFLSGQSCYTDGGRIVVCGIIVGGTSLSAFAFSVSGQTFTTGAVSSVGGFFNTPAGGICWDSASSKVVILSGSPTETKVVLGTLSGNNITLGSSSTIVAAGSSLATMSLIYQPSVGRTIATYGSSTVANASSLITSTATASIDKTTAFPTNSGTRVCVTYQSDKQNLLYCFSTASGYAFSEAAISANGTPSFGSVIQTGLTVTDGYPVIVYHTPSKRAVLGFRNSTLPYYSFIQMNVTSIDSKPFLGFSGGNYTNGQTATINSVGSVVSSVSGLTTGSSYYVQNDGSLSTTPAGILSVYAGIATSATSILVKG